ncbi:MAG: hypothetical protein JSU81_01810, partial [Candidatus Coatesbacteria bacterium]
MLPVVDIRYATAGENEQVQNPWPSDWPRPSTPRVFAGQRKDFTIDPDVSVAKIYGLPLETWYSREWGGAYAIPRGAV